jgi:hypothetical protein
MTLGSPCMMRSGKWFKGRDWPEGMGRQNSRCEGGSEAAIRAKIGQMCSFSGGRECEGIVMRCGLGVPATGQAAIDAGTERLLDDGRDGARAAAAFGAAAETAIDLLGVPGKLVRIVDGMADVVVAQDVTGTNDHEKTAVLP